MVLYRYARGSRCLIHAARADGLGTQRLKELEDHKEEEPDGFLVGVEGWLVP